MLRYRPCSSSLLEILPGNPSIGTSIGMYIVYYTRELFVSDIIHIVRRDSIHSTPLLCNHLVPSCRQCQHRPCMSLPCPDSRCWPLLSSSLEYPTLFLKALAVSTLGHVFPEESSYK